MQTLIKNRNISDCAIFVTIAIFLFFYGNASIASNGASNGISQNSSIRVDYNTNQRFISMGDVVQYDMIVHSTEELLFYTPGIAYNTAYPLKDYDFDVRFVRSQYQQQWEYTIRIYYTYFTIGSFTFAPVVLSGIKLSSQEGFRVQTQPLKIEVQGFDIKDFTKIKPYSNSIPFTFHYSLFFICLITIIISVIIILGIAKRNSKTHPTNSKKENSFVDYKDVIQKRLQILKVQQQEGEIHLKEFIVEIDKLTKSFLQRNIFINSEKQTKDIYDLIQEANISHESQKELSQFFRNIDFLKFSNTYLQIHQNKINAIYEKALYYINNMP